MPKDTRNPPVPVPSCLKSSAMKHADEHLNLLLRHVTTMSDLALGAAVHYLLHHHGSSARRSLYRVAQHRARQALGDAEECYAGGARWEGREGKEEKGRVALCALGLLVAQDVADSWAISERISLQIGRVCVAMGSPPVRVLLPTPLVPLEALPAIKLIVLLIRAISKTSQRGPSGKFPGRGEEKCS
ncbi:uncharacterized protein PG986_003092 [Apiospora aurea]|uniref:Uncharacterized protein n=1 Tax=Apiospora aurea TaxID=335848 RepID=A0ABR1QQQ3_9PEZI